MDEEVLSSGDLADVFNVYGYSAAQTLVQLLKQCGDDLTRENVMRQAASIKEPGAAHAVAGIRLNTSPPISIRSSRCS